VVLDEAHDVRLDRRDVGLPDVGDEDGEECPGVGEQEALPAFDPEQVQVPVVVRRRHIDESRGSDAEEGEHLRGAP
jgi:hypothetical protein